MEFAIYAHNFPISHSFFVVVSLGLEVTENPESVGKEYEAIS